MKEQNEKQAIEEMAKIIQNVAENHHRIWCEELAKVICNAGYCRQEWISVDERLPNEAERVLVYGENGFCFATRYKGAWLMPMIYPGELTHWMPLPEPPKGAVNDKQTHGS